MSTVHWRERSQLKRAISDFFGNNQFLEIETPMLVDLPGTEIHLQYFESRWNFQKENQVKYLRSSPELSLKQVLAKGEKRIFELGRCFRNGWELGPWHNPEFTMLEYYQTDTTFDKFIDFTCEFFEATSASLSNSKVSSSWLQKTWRKLTVAEAFAEFAKIKLVDGDKDFAAKARALGYPSVNASDDFETAYFKVLIDQVEPALKKLGAVVLYDFPPSQAALARVENGWAKRFEVYIHGVELCNAFDELTGFKENQDRLRHTEEQRRKHGYAIPSASDNLIRSWSEGLPRCCGNAVGFDRWLALLTSADNLDPILLRNYIPNTK